MPEEFIDASDFRHVSIGETRGFQLSCVLTTPKSKYWQRFASRFLFPGSGASCTNAETCTSCVTQLDRFQERQQISWNFVDVPSMKAQFRNSSKFTRLRNLLAPRSPSFREMNKLPRHEWKSLIPVIFSQIYITYYTVAYFYRYFRYRSNIPVENLLVLFILIFNPTSILILYTVGSFSKLLNFAKNSSFKPPKSERLFVYYIFRGKSVKWESSISI